MKFIHLLIASACALALSSCMTASMQEITARNNGAKFMLYTHPGSATKMEYRGAVDSANRAHGYGSYNLPDTFYGGNHFEGAGTFKHGQPDGDHRFRVPSPLTEGFHHYSNGKHTGMTKTKNGMPAHIAGSLMKGAQAYNADKPTAGGSSGADDGGPWYPIVWGTFGPGRPTTVGGVPMNEATQAIRLKPGAGYRLGRLVPKGSQ